MQSKADPQKIPVLQRYFKTGKGEYAEGDLFLGITIPIIRQIAKEFQFESLTTVSKSLKSPFHEERLCALIILTLKQNKQIDPMDQIVGLYLKNIRYINNWDLVDLSAPLILGPFFQQKSHRDLIKMAKSKNLWEKRIAVLTTFYFIKQGEFQSAFTIIDLLKNDSHDLIHKACGWMLREIGKRGGKKRLLDYLNANAAELPRTMLRYAIEHLDEKKRQSYLKQTRKTSV